MGYWEDNYGDDVDFVNPDDADWQLSQLSPRLTFLKRKDDALWEDIL